MMKSVSLGSFGFVICFDIFNLVNYDADLKTLLVLFLSLIVKE